MALGGADGSKHRKSVERGSPFTSRCAFWRQDILMRGVDLQVLCAYAAPEALWQLAGALNPGPSRVAAASVGLCIGGELRSLHRRLMLAGNNYTGLKAGAAGCRGRSCSAVHGAALERRHKTQLRMPLLRTRSRHMVCIPAAAYPVCVLLRL